MPYFESNGGGTPVEVGTVILTKEHPKIHFKSGYYKEFTATTDPSLSLAKKIEYRHHVHSTSSTNETVTTNSVATTTNGYDNGYHSASAGGCFQNKVVHGIYGKSTHTSESWGDGSWNAKYYCDKCGAEMGTRGQFADGKWAGWGCSKDGETHHCRDEVYYTCNCGKSRGQLISAKIYY